MGETTAHLSLHPPKNEERSGCFQVLAVMSKAMTNIHLQVYVTPTGKCTNHRSHSDHNHVTCAQIKKQNLTSHPESALDPILRATATSTSHAAG